MKFNIDKVAELAHLTIKEEEKEKFTEKILGVLTMIETLEEVTLEDNDSTKEIIPMEFREDIPMESLPRELVLKNAPQTQAGCIVVPKTVE